MIQSFLSTHFSTICMVVLVVYLLLCVVFFQISRVDAHPTAAERCWITGACFGLALLIIHSAAVQPNATGVANQQAQLYHVVSERSPSQ